MRGLGMTACVAAVGVGVCRADAQFNPIEFAASTTPAFDGQRGVGWAPARDTPDYSKPVPVMFSDAETSAMLGEPFQMATQLTTLAGRRATVEPYMPTAPAAMGPAERLSGEGLVWASGPEGLSEPVIVRPAPAQSGAPATSGAWIATAGGSGGGWTALPASEAWTISGSEGDGRRFLPSAAPFERSAAPAPVRDPRPAVRPESGGNWSRGTPVMLASQPSVVIGGMGSLEDGDAVVAAAVWATVLALGAVGGTAWYQRRR